jgi:multisubunit Na+/H+ antiporter MnhF subunit
MFTSLCIGLVVTCVATILGLNSQEEIVRVVSIAIATIGFLVSVVIAPAWLQVGLLLLPFLGRLNPFKSPSSPFEQL